MVDNRPAQYVPSHIMKIVIGIIFLIMVATLIIGPCLAIRTLQQTTNTAASNSAVSLIVDTAIIVLFGLGLVWLLNKFKK